MTVKIVDFFSKYKLPLSFLLFCVVLFLCSLYFQNKNKISAELLNTYLLESEKEIALATRVDNFEHVKKKLITLHNLRPEESRVKYLLSLLAIHDDLYLKQISRPFEYALEPAYRQNKILFLLILIAAARAESNIKPKRTEMLLTYLKMELNKISSANNENPTMQNNFNYIHGRINLILYNLKNDRTYLEMSVNQLAIAYNFNKSALNKLWYVRTLVMIGQSSKAKEIASVIVQTSNSNIGSFQYLLNLKIERILHHCRLKVDLC